MIILTFACLCLSAGKVARTKATAKNFIPLLNSSVRANNSNEFNASAFNSGKGSRVCICKYIIISWKYGCSTEDALRVIVLFNSVPSILHDKFLISSDSSMT